jgi:hypothetical protein
VSTDTMSWALKQRAGGPLDKLVLMLAADACGSGSCRVDEHQRWATIAEASENDVWRACLRLNEAGLIRFDNGRLSLTAEV